MCSFKGTVSPYNPAWYQNYSILPYWKNCVLP